MEIFYQLFTLFQIFYESSDIEWCRGRRVDDGQHPAIAQDFRATEQHACGHSFRNCFLLQRSGNMGVCRNFRGGTITLKKAPKNNFNCGGRAENCLLFEWLHCVLFIFPGMFPAFRTWSFGPCFLSCSVLPFSGISPCVRTN